MIDFLIVFTILAFSSMAMMFVVFIVYILGVLAIFGPAYLKKQIVLILRSSSSFMSWLYGDEYAEHMPVKVYSEGWRKGDYK